jgi:hypothetical protein
MTVYKSSLVIPHQAPPPAERPAAAEPNDGTPLAPTIGDVAADPSASPPEAQRDGPRAPEPSAPLGDVATNEGLEARLEASADADRDEQQDQLPPAIWKNDRWAVTEYGLESLTRAGPDHTLVEYPIDAARLLRVEPGTEGVSMWAVQLAAKSWLDDVGAMLEAIANALEIHHRGQTAIDMAATAAEARRVWERSRPKPSAHDPDLGHDYIEDADARFAGYGARAGGQAPTAPADWTANLPAKYRDVLRQYGMHPGDHAAAREYDLRLIELVDSGLTGDALAQRAEGLFREHFGDLEPEDWDGYPGDEVGD